MVNIEFDYPQVLIKISIFFTKRSMEILDREENNVLEQSIVISELGSIKKSKLC